MICRMYHSRKLNFRFYMHDAKLKSETSLMITITICRTFLDPSLPMERDELYDRPKEGAVNIS